MAYHLSPTDVDTIFNLQLLGMNRPYGMEYLVVKEEHESPKDPWYFKSSRV